MIAGRGDLLRPTVAQGLTGNSQRIKAAGDGGGLFDADRSRLAEDLDRSRARERELEDAGAQASVALGAAIAQIRSALTAQEA